MKDSQSNKFLNLALGFTVILAGTSLGATYMNLKNSGTTISSLLNGNNENGISVLGAFSGLENNYHAIFMTNGAVYFGKIQSNTEDEIILTDAHFLQVKDDANALNGSQEEAVEAKAPELSVVARTGVLHSPDGKMVIPRQNILFIETLKSDSKVIEAINSLKNS